MRRRDCASGAKRLLAGAVAIAALGVREPTARADEGSAPEPASIPPSLRYVPPGPEPEVARALAVQGGILLAGFGEYLLDTSNSRDFDLRYDWPSLKSKLTLRSVTFDNNRFPTNFVTHPLAGTIYYGAARAHRLSIAESFLLAAASSTLWEVVGEWREQASINDLLVTPISGVPLGESLFHLGAFFQRSRPGVATRTASWLFGGMKNLTDFADGVEPAPPPAHTSGGFPSDVWHRFHVTALAGATRQDGAGLSGDAGVRVGSRVVELDGYEMEGATRRWFAEGEISSIDVALTMSSERLTHLDLESRVVPIGYYERDVAGGHGHTSIVGLDVGFSYGLHDYDRDGRRPMDRVSIIDSGLRVEHIAKSGPWTARLGGRATIGLAGVGIYALDAWNASRKRVGVVSVVANEGYGFAFSTTLAPEAEASFGPVFARADARYDLFRVIDGGPDRTSSELPLARIEEQRWHARGAIGVRPIDELVLGCEVVRRERVGHIDVVRASRGETSFAGTVGFVF